jgi:LCP family protein required for cell wall assembly
MTFKTRKIRSRPPLISSRKIASGLSHAGKAVWKVSEGKRRYTASIIMMLIGILVVGQVMVTAYDKLKDVTLKDAVFALGADLKKDANGFTNIVLLGDGGHVRDGADLVDTIMLVSIDYAKNAVTMFSIPRDYYVGKEFNCVRINEIYRNNKYEYGEDAYGLYQKAVGELADVDVQYYVRVDFNAFVDIINAVGGIDIDVKTAIDDPYYPNALDDGYETFKVEAGLQSMNGETALKFARSRKTTSDFDRASRQQQVLAALHQKALSLDILTSPSKLKDIFDAVKRNMNTNMEWREIIELAQFADQWDRSNLVTKVIHDDPGQEGGFLYTPPREEHEGQFVLVPYGDNLDRIHLYSDLILKHREVYTKKAKIDFLNATKSPGIARDFALALNRYGFNVNNIDNDLDKLGERRYEPKSFIRYYRWTTDVNNNVIAEDEATIKAIQLFYNVEAVPGDPTEAHGADLAIVFGDDYKSL